MWSSAREVSAGDTVIIWLTRDQVQPLVITPGKDLNTKFGNFKQDDFVGVPYGSKVASRTRRGFVHLLRPTPELWTIALPHRTQILYLADIAFITTHLGIRKGSKVIEAGTGSASFSHSVARTIGSSGHLYSYEFHEARFIKAKEEFGRHGMADFVTIQHRNVCKDGFTVVDEVDSVFLDLPAPWEAIEHAKKALQKDRVTRICCFSPCMEQVLRTVNALNEAGFSEITMFETLLRPIEVFQTPPLPTISDLPEKLRQSEAKREEKRQRQIKANREASERAKEKARLKMLATGGGENGETSGLATKRKAENLEESIIKGEDAYKRTKTDDDADGEDVEMQVEVSISTAPTTSSTTLLTTPTPPFSPVPRKINVSKALPEVRGHTSYLTFACLVPNPRSQPTASASAASNSNSNTATANSTSVSTEKDGESLTSPTSQIVDSNPAAGVSVSEPMKEGEGANQKVDP